jgi:hypothetical protein
MWWELQRKGRTAAEFRCHAHLAAVKPHQVFDDRKTQPGPAQLARARFVRPKEAMKDLLQRLRRDADSGVLDGDPRPPLADAPGDPNRAAGLAELDRVIDEVDEYLFQTPLVRH